MRYFLWAQAHTCYGLPFQSGARCRNILELVLPDKNIRRYPSYGLQEALRGLLYRKAGMHDGKMRKDILYADFVLRESARQAGVAKNMCPAQANRDQNLAAATVEQFLLNSHLRVCTPCRRESPSRASSCAQMVHAESSACFVIFLCFVSAGHGDCL